MRSAPLTCGGASVMSWQNSLLEDHAEAGKLTDQSARLLNLTDYGFAVGRPADIVIVNAESPEQAIAEIAQPLAVFKHGRQTVMWHPPQLLRPRQY
jgi:cytosine/adenosine deaminase-related metal-dependent hydrolase